VVDGGSPVQPVQGLLLRSSPVARFSVEGEELVLHLSTIEKLEGFHDSIRVPVSSVREVRTADDPWTELRGLRAPGTGIPGVIAVGTRRGSGIRDFAVVHGKGPAVVVEMDGAEFGRFVVSDENASTIVGELRRDVGLV
jgi:hypothetical protein